MGWAAHLVGMEEMWIAYKIFIGKTERKRQFGRYENNSRMDLREIGWEGVDWIDLMGCCEHGNEPSVSIKVGKFLDKLRDSYPVPWS
jgi:hypothetical protein